MVGIFNYILSTLPDRTKANPGFTNSVFELKSLNSIPVYAGKVQLYVIFFQRDIERLCQHGIVESLLVVIGGTNQKHLNFALSTLGNMCIESKVKQQVNMSSPPDSYGTSIMLQKN